MNAFTYQNQKENLNTNLCLLDKLYEIKQGEEDFIQEESYEILFPLKRKKIKKSLNENPSSLNELSIGKLIKNFKTCT